MYLKNIEIQGFKSFAKKTEFSFPEGITGVVGPNGSGKSNVADAVRWVLGEQKIKQLRGSKMEDVIFAGTANRKPLGFASVSITLDNSDHKLPVSFDEVTVTRRVFRSGESEYMINGSICRLRDVQELFYDTGIGKEGYSIIGQGQIDKILQGKPEERREIFDEAVGIVKYKRRKTIALRKLESERLNISRISDILKELTRQVGPLERQAEAAKKFVKLKDDLKKYDLNFFLLENGDIKNKIHNFEEKEVIVKEDLEASKQAFENTKDEFEKISEEISDIDDQISELKEQIAQGDLIKTKMEGQIRVLNEQINSIKSAEQSYSDRYQEITGTIHRFEDEKTGEEAARADNEKALEASMALRGQIEESVIQIQDRNEELRNRIEESKEKVVSLINDKGKIHAQMERLSTLLEQMEVRKAELLNHIEQIYQDKSEQEDRVASLKQELQDAETAISDIEKEVSENEAKKRSIDDERHKLSAELEEAKVRLVNDSAKLESLKNITERYEGYGNSIKEVMALKSGNKGIHGVVADIIQVDKKYETAIEIALGGNIQNIVTDTEGTAKEIIEYLKKNKLGRATFLPLAAVKGRGEFKNTEVFDEKGVIGLASKLVQVEERYQGVANYLLGKVVVVDRIENALLLARKYNYSLLIVTLEGEYLNRGGSLTGGAFRNKSNLLSRRREIEELERSIKDAKSKQDNFDQEMERLNKSKELINRTLAEKNTQLQESRLYANTIRINLQQAEEKNDEISGGVKRYDEENRSIDQQSSNVRSENTSLNDALLRNEEATEQAKQDAVDLEAQLKSSMEEEAEELMKLQNAKMDHLKLVEQNSYLTNSVIKAETELEKLRQSLDALIENNQSSKESIKNKETIIKELSSSIEQSYSDRQALIDRLSELEKAKEERTGSHRDFIERREEYAKRVADLDKELFRLSSSREKLEERFENKLAYIWEEYELTYNSALPYRDESLNDEKFMKEQISAIKAQIKGLGNINVGAIEEYKEVKERYDFLKTQHDDLLKAEADLVKIIRDLDREMRKQFTKEFARIKEEFSHVFKEMFGGGTGTIELEEDVDILDAGITIIAQPPGKKLQNMMQLSGGEKALTAIAVLFAIQNLKPSPFCILDEIEAALDDANIEKFAAYLKELSKGIQFIVITHRKGTMEAAHRLYGITMQEKGVSSLISVNLEDVKSDMYDEVTAV